MKKKWKKLVVYVVLSVPWKTHQNLLKNLKINYDLWIFNNLHLNSCDKVKKIMSLNLKVPTLFIFKLVLISCFIKSYQVRDRRSSLSMKEWKSYSLIIFLPLKMWRKVFNCCLLPWRMPCMKYCKSRTITEDISEEIKKLTFNKSESEVIFPYFKISVEKYVFNKV